MHAFVYGTLTDPDRVSEVLGDRAWSFAGDATLRGLHRVDGRYPTLAPGGEVDGRLLETDAVDALDAYEGVARGLYVRVAVPTTGFEGASAAVYVGDPDRLDVAESVAWPGDDDLAARVRRYVDANDVSIAPR
ncbi:gamma-glutamylcyclotransferase family protein [Halorubellus litoreus]|uniref:Gamma-glutamylcyclotransferase n=1 Tax=Halorubellus litoreus TaxID=755308 RepID=A0ABD5V8Z9_9EURY